jgi:hypothetical protein
MLHSKYRTKRSNVQWLSNVLIAQKKGVMVRSVRLLFIDDLDAARGKRIISKF